MHRVSVSTGLRTTCAGAVSLTLCLLTTLASAADFRDPNADLEALPTVPDGFQVTMFAREPLVRQPCSMAFDASGRLFVGMGPQYRNPRPDTPGDSVVIVQDTDQDGRADRTQVFATGFNAIQGLAWHGRDLWVANAPDLTVVRDLDGDDIADEYALIYTNLGNLEHGLHGLCWAPDGKLYMSKGNSKGLTDTERVAPKPFRDLAGTVVPPGTPNIPAPKTFTRSEYRHSYHDPADDWGLDGGVLRCDDGGRNLEIVARGFRNPWDIAADSGFNWLGTDNDQTKGDRIFMPFRGAHFGWNHSWSSHWSDGPHLPTAPTSGPLFEGSGTGIVFGNSPIFPTNYRGVFFINDWLRKTTFVWRPTWDGALMRPAGGTMEPFIEGGRSLFRPTDIEFGPDNALWVLGWGSGYGAEFKDGELISEGRVFRIAPQGTPLKITSTPKRTGPLTEWSVAELLEEFDSPLPVRRIDAQDELVRRGPSIQSELLKQLNGGTLNENRETWTAWALGRSATIESQVQEFLIRTLQAESKSSLNLRLQAVRILARQSAASLRASLPPEVIAQLGSTEPRLRAAAVAALGEARQKDAVSQLLELLAVESDPVTFYSAWKVLGELTELDERQRLLKDPRGKVRLGALLSLLEIHALSAQQVTALADDPVENVRELAALWLKKTSSGIAPPKIKGPPLQQTTAEMPLVVNLKVGSGKKYRVISAELKPGARIFGDRKLEFKTIPDSLLGADYIQTANADEASQGNGFLTFEALVPVRVTVAFDTRLTTLPSWATQSFEPRDEQIRADGWTYRLVSREYPEGRIELGGNTDDGQAGGKSQYVVVVEPLPLKKHDSPATIDAILAILEQGDARRGEVLFKHQGGAGCSKCHSLDQSRNGFGPNLEDIGRRATAKHIVQSIIDPSAVITEGFSQQQVVTEEGIVHNGVLLEESGLSLTLGLATGESITIDKKKIELRQSTKISAMPPLAEFLQPQQIADLTAFLLKQRTSTQIPANKLEQK